MYKRQSQYCPAGRSRRHRGGRLFRQYPAEKRGRHLSLIHIYREIENFKPEEYWTLDANLTGDNDVKKLPFSARYHGKNGKKAELKSAAQVEEVVEETKNAAFTVKSARCV